MRNLKAQLGWAGVLIWLAAHATAGENSSAAVETKPAEPAMMSTRFEDLKWDKIVPELGDKSPEITILRVEPTTKATQLMIRVPKNFHVPKHWHTANETHTLVKGTFIIESEGQRQKLGQGSWNYVPNHMAHEAWTTPKEGALLFITVDSGWDVNWVGEAPKPADFLGGRKD